MAVGILPHTNRRSLGSSSKHWLCFSVYCLVISYDKVIFYLFFSPICRPSAMLCYVMEIVALLCIMCFQMQHFARDTYMTTPALTVTPHKHIHQQLISRTNENKTPFPSCNCGSVFSSFVSKDQVSETQGPADCFECLSTLYDCSVPQVLNKAAPLECSKRVSIVA